MRQRRNPKTLLYQGVDKIEHQLTSRKGKGTIAQIQIRDGLALLKRSRDSWSILALNKKI
jgi:hypothetical protein